MKPFPLVISILTSFSLSPAIAQQTLKLEPAREFYLKTKVTNPEYGSAGSKDALYVSSYHTGAGLSDATLSREITVAAKAYLNGTTLGFDFGTDFPWGFSIGTDTNYAGWESVMINAGKETNGFYFNDTDGSDDGGLKWNADYPGPVSSNNMWIGWLACDWFHGVPQLFWAVRNGILGKNATLIDTCTEVELTQVYVDSVVNASHLPALRI